MGVNKVILVGNVGQKPQLRYTPQGVPVITFSLATTERWGLDENGERKAHTEWHRCVAWRKLAEICGQYLDKGIKIYAEGRLRRREYTAQDGSKRFVTEILLDQMEILTPKGQREYVPEEPEYQEFPDTAVVGGRATAPSPGGAIPPPPDEEIDLEEDMDIDLEEDESSLIE